MNLKVVSTSPTFGYYATEPLEYLKTHGAQIVLAPQGKKMSEEELIEFVRDYDAIIVGIEKITAPWPPSGWQAAGMIGDMMSGQPTKSAMSRAASSASYSSSEEG